MNSENFTFTPKEYTDNGRTLEWGRKLSEENRQLLKKGEMFTLLDEKGVPYSTVLMDSYNQIRERRIDNED